MANKKTTIQPVGDRVLVEPFTEVVAKTASGIYLPETMDQEKPEQGKVIAVGSGRVEGGKKVPVAVKVGDNVIFSKYGYDEVTVDGTEYFMVKEENILAVIK